MTDTPSLGSTGGLPGSNAAPQASELPDDQLADTLGPVQVNVPDGGEHEADDAGDAPDRDTELPPAP